MAVSQVIDASDNDDKLTDIQYYLDSIRLLITYKVNINIRNNAGATALFEAVMFNNLNAVQVLLELPEGGADATIPDNQGRLPSTIAKCNEISDLLKWYENEDDVKSAIE